MPNWLKNWWGLLAGLAALVYAFYAMGTVKRLKRVRDKNDAVADEREIYSQGTDEDLDEIKDLRTTAAAAIAQADSIKATATRKLNQLQRERGSAKAADLRDRINAI